MRIEIKYKHEHGNIVVKPEDVGLTDDDWDAFVAAVEVEYADQISICDQTTCYF